MTPQTRAQILREMLNESDEGASRYRNVEVQGMSLEDLIRYPPSSISCIAKALISLSRNVPVVTGYIWRYASTRDATLFFRGIRTWAADGGDERKLQIQNTVGPIMLGPLHWPMKTVLLEGDPKYRDVSSTVVRKMCADRRQGSNGDSNGRLSEWVPESILFRVVEEYG